MSPTIHRWTAFSRTPEGGNPAGIVLLEGAPDDAWMLAIAAEVGYSETAFLWPADGERNWTVRYFSPQAEVPFCGHATIAAGALLGARDGAATHLLHTRAGPVALEVDSRDGMGRAALTSVEPVVLELDEDLLRGALAAFGWEARHLDPLRPPALAFGGSKHLLLPVRSRAVLGEMAYDFESLRTVMLAHDVTTVAALHRAEDDLWQARNAFPVGGVVEDPATGSAAAALGGWLRATGQVVPPATIVVEQGVEVGRPSRLEVTIPATGGIIVAGDAVSLD